MVIVVFGILLSFLYASSQLYYIPPHDPDRIYTEPAISQLQAIQTIEQDLKRQIPGFNEAYLHFQYYNFSYTEYENDETYQRYRDNVRPGWSLTHIKQNPELLNLALIFVHANGTHYQYDPESKRFEKTCEQPSSNCTPGRLGGEAARNRLVYEVGAIVEGANDYGRDIHYILDAETGRLVYHIPYFDPKPLPPRSIFDNSRTIKELHQLIDNTELGVAVEIVQNASEIAANEGRNRYGEYMKGYEPFDAREMVSNDTAASVVWFNYDSTSHTVTSDTDYEDILGKEFDSGIIEPGDTFEFVFIEEGYFSYHCEIHPWMQGRVEIGAPFA